jgi:hypothetical protein
MSDRYNGDETNVEGIAAEFAAHMPLEDAAACREIYKLLPSIVDALLANRAERHYKQQS